MTVEPVAIIGMACRVPGASDTDQFWRNLVAGVDSITTFTREEQAALGVPDSELDDPDFVPAAPVLDDAQLFDAGLFGIGATEAELLDPHHRLFLELAHTALEDAAHDPARYPGRIAVYAGTGHEDYKFNNLFKSERVMSRLGQLTVVGADPDYVATLASYKLDLRGPSFTLHTACSTSLVALHAACEALRNGECEVALAGGVHVPLPMGRGYLYVEGGILSPDGRCRPFDAEAGGTIWGAGGGVVVLKPLSTALADGDHVRAVVLGNAINNDGAKATFSGPSVAGQAEVIGRALDAAGVDPRTVGYVEAHATGTTVGDPIEVAALTQVFGAANTDRNWCGLGSVKANIGHLSQAAGIASVIKTVLAFEHGQLPPTVHFERPNPRIDFAASPFYVTAGLSDWHGTEGEPRRAGVSSFGVGGTNAHAVLQEAPQVSRPRRTVRPMHLLRVSAGTETALSAAVGRLADHLGAHPELDLADVAHTLAVGRAEHQHRAVAVARDTADAAVALADRTRLQAGKVGRSAPEVAFLFSGQGAQYAGMGAELYRSEPRFRSTVDACADLLAGELEEDLRPLLFAGPATRDDADARLRETRLTQPALFTVEYALAELWRSWGVEPAAMIGHSIGEYVAATVAGVFGLPDALRLVATRGRLMQSMPPGSMLAVQLDADEAAKRLPHGLSIATINAPGTCVVAGPTPLVNGFAERLAGEEVGVTPLRTSHAFHSPMMEPILAEFAAAVVATERRPPRLRFLSNVTGDWIAPDEATDPAYWSRHIREPVRFADCVARLLSEGEWALVECGPGRQLAGLARRQARQVQPAAGRRAGAGHPPMPSLPGPGDDGQGDLAVLGAAVGRLWTAGVAVRSSFDGDGYKVPLPTYPYERKYYWIDPDPPRVVPATLEPASARPLPIDDWFALPAWRQVQPGVGSAPFDRCLAFTADPFGRALTNALRDAGVKVVEVVPGEGYGVDAGGRYTIRPGDRTDYEKLVADLAVGGGVSERIVHAWSLGGPVVASADAAWQAQELGFFSLLGLAQSLAGAQLPGPVHLDVLTAGTEDVTGADLLHPEHATVAGIVKVLPVEVEGMTVRHLDLESTVDITGRDGPSARTVDAAVAELLREPRDSAVALRGGRRWLREYQPVPVPPVAEPTAGLRQGGVYLVTGGLGGVGRTLAEDLAVRARARLVLVGRSGLPPCREWTDPAPCREWTDPVSAGVDDRTRAAIEAVRRMEAAGAEVLVLAADVSDVARLRRVRAEALARFGRLDGILHAAGVPGGGMAEVKDCRAAEQVFAPKLAGTLALAEVFGDLEMDFVALFSSVTAVAGGFGQVDYCAANAFLDAYARSQHGFRAHVVSIDWGPWSEVGMAAEAGVGASPADAGAPTRADTARAAGGSGLDRREPVGTAPVDHPVFTTRCGADDGMYCYGGTVSPATHWVLDEHRVAGVPVLPGTAHLELARWAFQAGGAPPDPATAVELRDVTFLQPLAVADGSAAEVRVLVAPGVDGAEFQVVSAADTDAAQVHARGAATWVRQPGSAPVHDLAAIRERCTAADAAPEGGRQADRPHGIAGGRVCPPESEADGGGEGNLVRVGPHWPDPERLYIGPDEQLALLVAPPETAAELDRYWLHPALFDRATAFPRLPDPGNAQYLPLGYGRLLVRGPLPARVWSHVRYTGSRTGEVIAADVTVVDDEGREVVAVNDFLLRRVDVTAMGETVRETPAAPAAPPPAAAAPPAGTAASPVDTGAPAADTGAADGQSDPFAIRPADGAEAFHRLLATDLGPQVVVTPVPLERILAEVGSRTAETVEGEDLAAVVEAPADQPRLVDGEYVAPRTDLERTLARIWGDVLGVGEVGVEDDFFELGGNSLVGVQLIAQVRKAANVKLPMRTLFDMPTVAGMAVRVDELRAAAESADADGAAAAAPASVVEPIPTLRRS